MQAMNSYMAECTADEWSDYLSDLRTFQTEETFRSGYSVMYSRLSPHGGYAKPGTIVGEVHYLPDGTRRYFMPRHAKGV
jgi:hypothetical protein